MPYGYQHGAVAKCCIIIYAPYCAQHASREYYNTDTVLQYANKHLNKVYLRKLLYEKLPPWIASKLQEALDTHTPNYGCLARISSTASFSLSSFRGRYVQLSCRSFPFSTTSAYAVPCAFLHEVCILNEGGLFRDRRINGWSDAEGKKGGRRNLSSSPAHSTDAQVASAPQPRKFPPCPHCNCNNTSCHSGKCV